MPAKATAAAQRLREEIMHPFTLQQLAAEHVKGQLAAADDARRARQASRVRSRASKPRTRLSLPGTQARLERRSATIAAAAVPATDGVGHWGDGSGRGAHSHTPAHASAS
jgi:hypothetical protein